ncbi:hypothetical protein [Bradyrhizobium sp. RDI18]|uniref:hypothetical protein n=1 Tax=Bradyrhizobium sp. RDI18 TaxID=3367400 RepID=UPI0037128259
MATSSLPVAERPATVRSCGLGNDRDLLDLAAVTVLMTLEMDLLAVAGGLQL